MSALPVPLILLKGDSFALGYAHGAARSAPLRAFLGDSVARLNRVLPEPVTLAGLQPLIAAYDAAVRTAAPQLAEEISGLAAGAGITREEASLLQLRREIMGYRRVPTAGDCTTYARAGAVGTDPVLAQTVDLNGNLDDEIAVLQIARTGSPRRVMVLSFAGLLGYLGLNSDGLAVGINLVLGGDWRPGLPPYLANRHLLDTASTVDEAIGVLRGLRLASSRSIMLCDRNGCAYVEILGDEIRVVAGPELIHTNHYLHPDLAVQDELNIFARNSSNRRYRACEAALALLEPKADPEEHFALLATSPVCVPDEGDIRRERTVAAVVISPATGEMHVRPGDPSLSRTHRFALG